MKLMTRKSGEYCSDQSMLVFFIVQRGERRSVACDGYQRGEKYGLVYDHRLVPAERILCHHGCRDLLCSS